MSGITDLANKGSAACSMPAACGSNFGPAPQPLLAVVKLPPALRAPVKLPPPPLKLPALLEAREVGRLSSTRSSFSTLSTVLRLMKRCRGNGAAGRQSRRQVKPPLRLADESL